jgi:hypothetical protein
MNTSLIGNTTLSAWRVSPGFIWVQTSSAQFDRKLSRRFDSQLVAYGVAGRYLRTFEFNHGLAWARRLIARYHQPAKVANNQFSVSECPPACQTLAFGVMEPETVLHGSCGPDSTRFQPGITGLVPVGRVPIFGKGVAR